MYCHIRDVRFFPINYDILVFFSINCPTSEVLFSYNCYIVEMLFSNVFSIAEVLFSIKCCICGLIFFQHQQYLHVHRTVRGGDPGARPVFCLGPSIVHWTHVYTTIKTSFFKPIEIAKKKPTNSSILHKRSVIIWLQV